MLRRLNIWQSYFLGFIILIILIILITSFVVIKLFNTGIEQQSKFTINKELDTAQKVFYTQLDNLFLNFNSLSLNLLLQDAYLYKDPNLQKILTNIKHQHDLSFLTIVEPNGRIAASANNPILTEEKYLESAFLSQFFNGQSQKGIVVLDENFLKTEGLASNAEIRIIQTPEANEAGEMKETRGLAQVVSVPVIDNYGNVQAYLLGGKLLNRDVKFVDEVSSLLKVYATIFLDDLRISTSVRLENGERALGTRVSPEVAAKVLERGERYLGQASIIGENYLTAYDPIFDNSGEVIGILFVGIPEAPFVAMKESTVRQYIYISLISIILALAIAYSLSRKITGPLQRLAKAMQKVELGDLSQRFSPDISAVRSNYPAKSSPPAQKLDAEASPPKDEIEILGNFFNRMMNSLQKNWEQNLKLQKSLEEKEKNRVKLLQKLISVQEEERKRIARELHDGTSQSLTSLMLILRAIQQSNNLEEVRKLAETYREVLYNTLEEIKKISYELRPVTLDKLGIDEAIKRYIRDLTAHIDIKIIYDNEECKFSSLDQEIETTVYRIVQEAITNAIRHARPKNIDVILRSDDQFVEVTIKDDGVGFELEEVQDNWENGLGIPGMMERVSLLKGELSIDTAPGQGTLIKIKLPLKK
ncbi:MAG: HAMP domain-containing protein [Firmicutes bacterium]|nr:HAMP domain-containing protein [Bacillota bacterium]